MGRISNKVRWVGQVSRTTDASADPKSKKAAARNALRLASRGMGSLFFADSLCCAGQQRNTVVSQVGGFFRHQNDRAVVRGVALGAPPAGAATLKTAGL